MTGLHGRRAITTAAREITPENLAYELREAYAVHLQNRREIEYLYRYYKGDQPILQRKKEIRSDICNRVVENRANEIVAFKVGYLCGEPIQYVAKSDDPAVSEEIACLNGVMYDLDKAALDEEIVTWQMICGSAYRLLLPGSAGSGIPFELFTLDPRDCFTVCSAGIGGDTLMGVKILTKTDGSQVFSVYTADRLYTVEGDRIVEETPHSLGMVPIFEYPSGMARLGAFEIVLPLLDALNTVASNRIDGVEQFVQAFWKFVGCRIDEQTFQAFLEKGAILVPPSDTGGNIDVDLITRELNQGQTQTLKDDLYASVLTICGIPNRNGGSSTSDTGAAVLLRDGWSLAEARAKDSEHMFRRAEKKMLRLALRICRETAGMTLSLRDIDIHFTRRNYEGIQSKSQVLCTMLKEPQIHPLLAFQHSGLFVDPESAYAMSAAHYEEVREREEAALRAQAEELDRTFRAEEAPGEDPMEDPA